jgi:hypothetical protein
MYYEEQVIDDRLMFRTSPNGDWKLADGMIADLINLYLKMSPDIRKDFIYKLKSMQLIDDSI